MIYWIMLTDKSLCLFGWRVLVSDVIKMLERMTV